MIINVTHARSIRHRPPVCVLSVCLQPANHQTTPCFHVEAKPAKDRSPAPRPAAVSVFSTSCARPLVHSHEPYKTRNLLSQLHLSDNHRFPRYDRPESPSAHTASRTARPPACARHRPQLDRSCVRAARSSGKVYHTPMPTTCDHPARRAMPIPIGPRPDQRGRTPHGSAAFEIFGASRSVPIGPLQNSQGP